MPVNPRFPRAEVDLVLETTRPAVLVTEAGIEMLATGSELYESDVAFVMWTSGTTGRPKAIRHTHTAYLELLDRVLRPLRGTKASADREPATNPEPDAASPRVGADGGTPARSDAPGSTGPVGPPSPTPNLIPVSMALNAGLYNALFGLRAGAALVMMDRFEPHRFAELVRRFEIRSTVLPPAAMVMLAESDVTDLAPLRYVRSITAPLSPLQARRFVDRFAVQVLNGYGQAEIGEVIGWTAADAKAHPEKVGAVGRPHPGVAIRVDEADHLWVRPPNTAVGIEERMDAEGFIDTGDLARVDEDGFVWIEGRAGEMINRGGNKVAPSAVEEVLRLSPTVDDVAVVAGPDDRLGEVPVAFLVGRPVPDDELLALCREHLVAYKVPAAFHWLDELPRSEVGKVLTRDLQARLT